MYFWQIFFKTKIIIAMLQVRSDSRLSGFTESGLPDLELEEGGAPESKAAPDHQPKLQVLI